MKSMRLKPELEVNALAAVSSEVDAGCLLKTSGRIPPGDDAAPEEEQEGEAPKWVCPSQSKWRSNLEQSQWSLFRPPSTTATGGVGQGPKGAGSVSFVSLICRLAFFLLISSFCSIYRLICCCNTRCIWSSIATTAADCCCYWALEAVNDLNCCGPAKCVSAGETVTQGDGNSEQGSGVNASKFTTMARLIRGKWLLESTTALQHVDSMPGDSLHPVYAEG
ncbi:hypothetical protein MLD38_015203 [Melastoma candidum]|uniref:Uncharacterized protein n=1 Tax=Melastoma candidum TaxID=119954 RepID=A0ACB9RGH8_9MYRT|nr:hypothetical protein MLD38_015203 [Melastoma candidum]